MVSAGVKLATASSDVTCRAARSSPVKAVIAIGVSWIFSLRRRAVTVISSMIRRGASSAAVTVAGSTRILAVPVASSMEQALRKVIDTSFSGQGLSTGWAWVNREDSR